MSIVTSREEQIPTTVRFHVARCDLCGHEEKSSFGAEDATARALVHIAVKHVEERTMRYASETGWRQRVLYKVPDEDTFMAVKIRIRRGNGGDEVRGDFTRPGFYLVETRRLRYEEGNGGWTNEHFLHHADAYVTLLETRAADAIGQARDLRAATREEG